MQHVSAFFNSCTSWLHGRHKLCHYRHLQLFKIMSGVSLSALTFPVAWWNGCTLAAAQRLSVMWSPWDRSRAEGMQGRGFRFHTLIHVFVSFLWSGCKFISGRGNTNTHAHFTSPHSPHRCLGRARTNRRAHMRRPTLTQQLSSMDLDPVLSHPHSHSHSQIPLYAQLCTWLGVWGHLTDLLGCRNSTDTLIHTLSHTRRLIYTHQQNTHPRISIYTHFRKLLPASLWEFTGFSIISHMFNSSKAQSIEQDINVY